MWLHCACVCCFFIFFAISCVPILLSTAPTSAYWFPKTADVLRMIRNCLLRLQLAIILFNVFHQTANSFHMTPYVSICAHSVSLESVRVACDAIGMSYEFIRKSILLQLFA